MMNRDEMKAKMAELNAKMKDSLDTAKIIGLEAQDKLKVAMDETKSNVNALKESYQIYSKRVKGKASSELIKAQMNLEVAKEELAARKEAHDKEKLEKYIEDMLEYAEGCVMLSAIAAKEAELAKLEAMDAQKEYDEKYGEEKKSEE
ncbi:MAG: hypothetical protein IJ777_02900 [Clostridia bacterium]|nr:hypothetical protein [Clostridia bacterium]